MAYMFKEITVAMYIRINFKCLNNSYNILINFHDQIVEINPNQGLLYSDCINIYIFIQ